MTFTRAWTLLFAIVLLVSTAGCAAVTGIFKAGVWAGIIIAVMVLGLVLFLFSRMTR